MATSSTATKSARAHREFRVKMAKRSLSLRDVSRLSGVPYTSASAILAGRMIHPDNFERIIAAIESAPLPEDAKDEITAEEYRAQTREIAGRAGRIKMQLPRLTKRQKA